MIGIKNNRKLGYAAELIKCVQLAACCHARCMQRGNFVTDDPKWYSNERKGHMNKARYYKKLLGEGQ